MSEKNSSEQNSSQRHRALVMSGLVALETSYWYEVDHNWGRNAADMYVADGTFTIGEQTMNGHEEIRAFYRWREGRGARVARHVVSNFHLLAAEGDVARFVCILCLYAADGVPILESKPPIMIADIVNECVLDRDACWRFRSHELRPLFMGGTPPTVPSAPIL
jgi:hypothetical protein